MTCFSVWIEMNSVFVSGHRNRVDVRVGIEIYMMSVMGSKLTCFLFAGLELIDFVCGIGIDLIFVWRASLTFFLCLDRA